LFVLAADPTPNILIKPNAGASVLCLAIFKQLVV
jgi:hypothetical protein